MAVCCYVVLLEGALNLNRFGSLYFQLVYDVGLNIKNDLDPKLY